jgi:hypothetical protein
MDLGCKKIFSCLFALRSFRLGAEALLLKSSTGNYPAANYDTKETRGRH